MKRLKQIDCTHYGQCLNAAALVNMDFDCEACSRINNTMSLRWEGKLCSGCKNIYPRAPEFFWRDKYSGDGLDYVCKICRKNNGSNPVRKFKKFSCYRCKKLRECEYQFQPPCYEGR